MSRGMSKSYMNRKGKKVRLEKELHFEDYIIFSAH